MRAAPPLCLALGVVTAVTGFAQEPDSAVFWRQVISAETLRNAGVTRLNEIVFLANAWDVASVDGFTWQLSPRGLASYQRQDWDVMVGNLSADFDLFGAQSLNRLPITLSQIDSVEFFSVPGVRAWGFIDSGLIRIHLRRPPEGLSIGGYAVTANETGDPGPFAFTELATPNIDRIGSGGSGVISYRRGRLFTEISGSIREHFVTDPPMRQRSFDITVPDEHPIIKQEAASFRAALETRGGTHEVFLGHSSTTDYYLLKPFGREVPAESPLTQAGISGAFRLSPGTDLRYRAQYSVNELDEHSNTLDLNYDWRIDRWIAQAEVSRDRQAYRATLGATFERTSAETGFALDDDDYDLASVYGTTSYPIGDRVRQTLDVAVVGDGEQVGFKGAFTHWWRVATNHSLEAAVSYTERLPEADDRVWFWLERGYSFLQDNGVAVSADGGLEEARRLAGDLDWRVEFGDATTLSLGGYVRAFRNLLLEDQTFEFNPTDGAFSGPVALLGDQGGEIGGASFSARYRTIPVLELEGFYRYQDVIHGDSLFEAAWSTVPKSIFRVSAMLTPLDDVSIWGMLYYRSSSRWPDYRDAQEQSDGLYSFEVDDALTFNLAAQKWFWDRRLRLNLQLRNILNDTSPHHPIGAAYDLTFIVQGELLLDSVWRPR